MILLNNFIVYFYTIQKNIVIFFLINIDGLQEKKLEPQLTEEYIYNQYQNCKITKIIKLKDNSKYELLESKEDK
ncbi:MAG: hypothetical protein SPLM_09900 [Spiroplasma phoeniceum]|uniref:hypothetical protein n=1 Tax=Spiroplasma phoeniceum TaxID=47835 RepID=UPI003133F6AA